MNVVGDREKVVANIQAYIIDDPENEGSKSLLLRGFNPTQKFLNSGISPDSFVESVFEVAKEFKEKNNLDHIYITEQGG
jgi:hypothetical protein